MAKSPEVAEDLRAYLKELDGKSQFDLTFSYNGTDYKTRFDAVHTGKGTDEEVIDIENECVGIAFGYPTGPPGKQTFVRGFIGHIQAENGTRGLLKGPACFQPILATNGRDAVRKSGKRTTSGDVLQILKSKLGLAFPVVRKDNPLELVDASRNEPLDAVQGSPTMISPFHLVRGGNAYYEKYGYRSPAITKLKRDILAATWVTCSPITQAVILECTGKKKTEYRPGDLLVDIMKGIAWDDERAYNERPWDVDRKVDEIPRKSSRAYNKLPPKEHYVYEFDKKPSLSSIVFREFARLQGTTVRNSFQWTIMPSIWTFQLDTDSEDWKRCDAELVLTGFSAGGAKPVGGAGKGRTRQRKARKSTRNRTRRQ